MSKAAKLILASGSPRRQELLERAGLEFEVITSGIEEVRRSGENVCDYALRMARDKALAVTQRRPEAIVLAADTVVECDGVILEKPADPNDARRMLNFLSGRTHTVVTAFALARRAEVLEIEAVKSRVTFRPLGTGEIEAYIASGEPLDKAGAYGIQGLGASFIARVEGSRDNVMGLPVREVTDTLVRYGVAARGSDRL